MNAQALHNEVAGFFDSFVEAFSAFSGAGIATLYFVPGVALRGDGSIQCLTSRADVEHFFQAALDGYYRDGGRAPSGLTTLTLCQWVDEVFWGR